MGGCCCCCAYKNTERNRSPPFLQYPVSEEREPLSPHNTAVSAISTGLLVNTYLDTSVPDTYQPPPAPIPYETYVGWPSTPRGNREGSGHNSEVAVENTSTESAERTNAGSTLETKIKNLESDENAEIEASEEMEDERSDELKKSTKIVDPPLQDEDDICPICLEEYDEENPKILTKCDHHFHLACILEWMERSNTCAMCDQEMIISSDVGG